MDYYTVFVTVLMPVYNGEDYLRAAIESILTQSHKEFELLIINDGSIDSTESIILSFDDPRIRYIRNQKNLGLIETLNRGLSESKGVYIARMDADDIAHPHRLEKQLQFMRENPDVIVCGTNYQKFGVTNEIVILPETNEHIKFQMIIGNPVCHPSVIIRLNSLKQNNLTFDSNFLHAEDYHLWSKLIRLGKFHNLQEILLNYRQHEQQVSSLHQLEQNEVSKQIQIAYLESIFKVKEMKNNTFHSFIDFFSGKDRSLIDVAELIDFTLLLAEINSKIEFFDQVYFIQKINARFQSLLYQCPRIGYNNLLRMKRIGWFNSNYFNWKQRLFFYLQVILKP